MEVATYTEQISEAFRPAIEAAGLALYVDVSSVGRTALWIDADKLVNSDRSKSILMSGLPQIRKYHCQPLGKCFEVYHQRFYHCQGCAKGIFSINFCFGYRYRVGFLF